MSLVQGLHDDWYITDVPDDVEVLVVLVEDSSSNPADEEDAADFVAYTGVTFPVLGDAEGAWIADWGGGANGNSQHSYTIIASDGTIGWRKDSGSSASVAEITANLGDIP